MFHICHGVNKLIKFDQSHLNRLPELTPFRLHKSTILRSKVQMTITLIKVLNSSKLNFYVILNVTLSYLEKMQNSIQMVQLGIAYLPLYILLISWSCSISIFWKSIWGISVDERSSMISLWFHTSFRIDYARKPKEISSRNLKSLEMITFIRLDWIQSFAMELKDLWKTIQCSQISGENNKYLAT